MLKRLFTPQPNGDSMRVLVSLACALCLPACWSTPSASSDLDTGDAWIEDASVHSLDSTDEFRRDANLLDRFVPELDAARVLDAQVVPDAAFVVQDAQVDTALFSNDTVVDMGNNFDAMIEHDAVVRVPATVITLVTGPNYPAMVLRAQVDAARHPVGALMSQTQQVLDAYMAVIVFDGRTYPPDTFCALRVSATYYGQPEDVDQTGHIVGDPDGWLCRAFHGAQGMSYILNPAFAVWISVGDTTFSQADLVAQPDPNDPEACVAVLPLSVDGTCAL